MSFDTALSGIRAASSDLAVSGNNIANASTTGFKGSRAEFSDVYASSVMGGGANTPGAGVKVSTIRQDFSQGNVSFTERALDLAVNGSGFFVVKDGGDTAYTRAGTFGLDQDGYIVSSNNNRLQGFAADAEGNVGGVPGDLQIKTGNLDPRRTTGVDSLLNLDAASDVLQVVGRQFTTEGFQVGQTVPGLKTDTTTNMNTNTFTLPLANDFSTTDMTFDVALTNASNSNGQVSITLNTAVGVPATVSDFGGLQALVSAINSQLTSPAGGGAGIGVTATTVDQGGGNYAIEFKHILSGESSTISIPAVPAPSANAAQIGIAAGLPSTAGIPEVSNGYSIQSIDIVDPDGNVETYATQAEMPAATIASQLNAFEGVTATATTDLTISSFNNNSGNMKVEVNGVVLQGADLASIATEINGLTTTLLPGISASYDGTTLSLNSSGGADIRIAITGDDTDNLSVLGSHPSAQVQTLEVDTGGGFITPGANVFDSSTHDIVVGGQIDITTENGFRVDNPVPIGTALIQALGNTADPNNPNFTDVTLNQFDPDDQNTYNDATSLTIFDSLGNPHVMTQYFVKQPYDATAPVTSTNSPNHWKLYVQIDGNDVGDPSNDPRASYDVYFNDDGTLDNNRTPDMLISNWTPLDDMGQPTGADGPQNILAGGGLPVAEPPTSSNFQIELNGTTQFGSSFSVNAVDQDGYATGRLSGLNIDGDGVVFARYTNGESLALGQVALAAFANEEGLQPLGDTMWAENFSSGAPSVAPANTGPLGAIQSGALEESNVDLSNELVKLIVAQRNYQANAKTIETADAVTQTIINI